MIKTFLTPHQSQYYAWLLTRRAASDSVESLASTLVDSQVDLNPHQVDAALFACKNPLSRGVILADESGWVRRLNVTKTILNQCNSIFAMRTFDDTGKEFLSNYIGRDYGEMLSNLPDRHAVFFGRGSSCENPVLIELNNRDNFKELFREKYSPSICQHTEASGNIAVGDGKATV